MNTNPVIFSRTKFHLVAFH